MRHLRCFYRHIAGLWRVVELSPMKMLIGDKNLKDETWTLQMAGFMGRVIRPNMKAFLEKKGVFIQIKEIDPCQIK